MGGKTKIVLVAMLFCSLHSFGQHVALKTNLLYDATSTLNVGVETALSQKLTLDISGNYNPWTFSGNKKMKHWMVQPELRYWTCQRFSGHFLGVHVFGGEFNMGGMLPWSGASGRMFGQIGNSQILDYRHEGWLAGGGLSYGYHWILGKRLGMELTFGLGYAHLKYDKFRCEKCGDKLGNESKNYLGPTKAGVSLIYMIK